MNIQIFCNTYQYQKWTEFKDVFVIGHAWYKEKLYKQNELAELIQKEKNMGNLVNELNGFFSFIKYDVDVDEYWVVVDRVRSIPLFYTEKDNSILISESAELLREHLNLNKFDYLCKEEFLLTGYVTGSDTLFCNIKQVQAGEYLHIFNKRSNYIQNNKIRYYQFNHDENFSGQQKSKIIERLNAVMDEITLRLLQYIDNRQVIIPLSAGRDSRLLLIKLIEHGYRDIVCFSYGTKNNLEAKISKEIAEVFGLKWHFIEYTEELWKSLWCSEERKSYYEFSSNWVSLPHVQDFPAVKYLKENNLIDSDAIFLPGHSGDFVAGSHIPLYSPNEIKRNFSTKLLKRFYLQHYNLLRKSDSKMLVQCRIERFLSSKSVTTIEEFANSFEKGDWQERQSKFIINSVRVYEYFQYEWIIPLWDNELLRFWSSVPLEYRINRNLYNEYVDCHYEKLSGEKPRGTNIGETGIKTLTRDLFLRTNFIYPLRSIRTLLKNRERPGKNNIMGIYGYYPYKISDKESRKIGNPNGFATLSFMNEYSKYVDEVE